VTHLQNHNAACSKHEPTTGVWFIESDNFGSWLAKANQLLWLHGIPGCGKTVLCSTIIEHVKGLSRHTADIGFAYFYFDFNDEKKQTLEGFLRSVLVQISCQIAPLPDEVQNLYNQYEKQKVMPNKSQLIETFFSLVRRFRRTYIIVDALDECTEREDMLVLITDIINHKSEATNLLIMSRIERDIEIALRGIATDAICIQSAIVDADIMIYVRSCLSHDQKLKGRPDSIKKEIEKALVEGAHGMYLTSLLP
jgi:hypothetical protein